jgi:hypothetical protein
MSRSTHERHVRYDLSFQQEEDNKDSETIDKNSAGEDEMTLSFSFLAFVIIAAIL